MKIPIILVAIVIGLGLLFFLLRSRVAPTCNAAANEIPSVVEKLQFGEGNPRFAGSCSLLLTPRMGYL